MLTKYQINKNVVGILCGREIQSILWWGNVKERDRLEDLVSDGNTILTVSERNRIWTRLI